MAIEVKDVMQAEHVNKQDKKKKKNSDILHVFDLHIDDDDDGHKKHALFYIATLLHFLFLIRWITYRLLSLSPSRTHSERDSSRARIGNAANLFLVSVLCRTRLSAWANVQIQSH